MKRNRKICVFLLSAFLILTGCAERPSASYADGSPQSSSGAESPSQAATTEAPVSAAEESSV